MTIPHDKVDHFLVGHAIAAVLDPFGYMLAVHFGVPAFVGRIAVLICVSAVAIGKEKLWDALGHGTPEWNDAIATVIGGVLLLGWYETAARWL